MRHSPWIRVYRHRGCVPCAWSLRSHPQWQDHLPVPRREHICYAVPSISGSLWTTAIRETPTCGGHGTWAEEEDFLCVKLQKQSVLVAPTHTVQFRGIIHENSLTLYKEILSNLRFGLTDFRSFTRSLGKPFLGL